MGDIRPEPEHDSIIKICLETGTEAGGGCGHNKEKYFYIFCEISNHLRRSVRNIFL